MPIPSATGGSARRRCRWPQPRRATRSGALAAVPAAEGKLLTLVRLAKASATFAGGVDYIAWKINRHAGTEIAIKPWQRRWPLLAAITLLPRLSEVRARFVSRPRQARRRPALASAPTVNGLRSSS